MRTLLTLLSLFIGAPQLTVIADPSPSVIPDVEARLGDRTLLVVKAIDENRNPLKLRCRKTWRDLERWPDTATIGVYPVPAHSSPFRSDLVQLAAARSDQAIAFELLTDLDYWVILMAPGHAPQRARVSTRAETAQVEHTFTLDKGRQPGAVLLEAFDPSNAPVTENVQVRILDPLTGALLVLTQEVSRSFVLGEWPARLPLPAGEYLIEVWGAASAEHRHGTLLVPRKWGEYRATIRVVAGQDTELQARLNAPAWIKLTLKGQSTQSDRDAALINNPALAPSVLPEFLEQRLAMYAKRASVQLVRESGYPTTVPFTHKDVGGSTPGALRLSGYLNLGTQQNSEALAPGMFQLQVSLPGGRKFTRNVELVGGEVLGLEVDLGS